MTELIESITILDKGFVKLLDCLASDEKVIQAARVSTGAASDPQRDRGLIFFLMENRHETPFEHLVFRFHIKCPIFVARQWFRHRIASYNEASARYRILKDEFYIPVLADLPPDIYTENDIQEYIEAMEHSYQIYEKLINKVKDHKDYRSRAREVFRGLLGTAFYTEFYWTINFRSLMNFMNLRTHPSAQFEIRKYAEAIRDIIAPRIPICFEAFEKYILNGRR